MNKLLIVEAIKGVLDLSKRSGKEFIDFLSVRDLKSELNQVDFDYIQVLNDVLEGGLLFNYNNKCTLVGNEHCNMWLQVIDRVTGTINDNELEVHLTVGDARDKTVYILFTKLNGNSDLDFYVIDRPRVVRSLFSQLFRSNGTVQLHYSQSGRSGLFDAMANIETPLLSEKGDFGVVYGEASNKPRYTSCKINSSNILNRFRRT